MSKVSNVLSMLEILSTGNIYSINELSNELEVTPRMIRVYKDELEKSGIYLKTIKGPHGGYAIDQAINIPKRLTGLELKSTIKKDIYKDITSAIATKRKCYIEYFSNDKSLTKRIIHPYELINLNNEWGLVAFCEKRNELRVFDIKRIKNINILVENYY